MLCYETPVNLIQRLISVMNWTSKISIVISVLGLILLTVCSAHGSMHAVPLTVVCQYCGLELLRKCKHCFLFHFIPESDIVYPGIKEALNCSRNRPEISDMISWSLIVVSPRLLHKQTKLRIHPDLWYHLWHFSNQSKIQFQCVFTVTVFWKPVCSSQQTY